MKLGKVALITGVTGQDGAYLARLLLDKGYVVHGLKRRSSSFNTGRIEDIYARGMWLMLQQAIPDDYVLATGKTSSVRSFVEWAFAELGVNLQWHGEGIHERGLDAASGRCLVEVDPRYFRPAEVDILLGDPSKARDKLGWKARITARDLVAEMVREDLRIMQTDRVMRDA
ncbi:MAG: hypothetical protein ABS75_20655 [Pelagibacterium sp. SCN 63-23]|nr:MAG: hypothetical protein ABS75_20655 [Pelagibacterium sp. SCN 63-23]